MKLASGGVREEFPFFHVNRLDRMSQAVACPCGRAFMEGVTRSLETDVPARSAASGRIMARVIVLAGFVLCAVLLVTGPPRRTADPVPADRIALAPVLAAAAGYEAVPSSDHAVAPIVAEADDAADGWSGAEPLANALLRPSEARAHARERAIVPARDSAPPDRPPRRG